jgi:endogenous inhibitor of DNA gyrase (YacG/DUF329 family)
MSSMTDPDTKSSREIIRCTICRSPIPPERLDHRPFCSRRCQELDLANWLNEQYGLPWEGDEPEDDFFDSDG